MVSRPAGVEVTQRSGNVKAVSRGVGRGRVEAGVEAGRGVERPVSQAPFKSWVYDQN